MIMYFTISALFICIGSFLLLSSLMQLPTYASVSGFDGIFNNKSPNIIDRLVESLEKFIEPHIHMNKAKKQSVLTCLHIANMHVTPEQYILSAWIKSIPIIVLGAIFCFVNLVSGICFFAAGCTVLINFRTKASRIAKVRQFNLETNLPSLVSHILNSMSYPQTLYTVLLKYLPIAGTTMHHELSILLADMRTGNHDMALNRFRARAGSDLITRFTLGLIGMDHGEDMRNYFEGLAKELKSWSTTQLSILASKRPQELFVSDILLYLGIIVLIAVSIFSYLQSAITAFF